MREGIWEVQIIQGHAGKDDLSIRFRLSSKLPRGRTEALDAIDPNDEPTFAGCQIDCGEHPVLTPCDPASLLPSHQA